MIPPLKEHFIRLLRWSEQYTGIDMVYFVSGNAWLFIGRFVATGTGLALTVGFANLLSQNDFGTYKYVLATAGLISAITLTGITPGVQRALAKGYTNVIRPMVAYAERWSVGGVLLALGVAAYYGYQGNNNLAISFIAVAVVTFFSWTVITKVLFNASGEFRTGTYYGIVRSVVPTVILIGVLFFTQNVLLIILTFFISQTALAIITYYRSLKRIQPKESTEYLEETKQFSRHSTLIGFVSTIAQYADQFLMWHFLGPVALATYALAQGPAKELRTLAESVSTVALPKIMKRDPLEQVENNTIVRRSLQSFLALAVLVAIYILCAPFVFRLLFPVYVDAIVYSQLLALVTLFQPRYLFLIFLSAHSTIRDLYTLSVSDSLIRLVFLATLIPIWGIYGAIAAIFLTEVISTGIAWHRYRKFSKKITDDTSSDIRK
ncbi:hypothetical protein C4585_01930 [Candidatus Parcubacteria bacterium]|nr:MAG: hypothetical protein C4585_01930 [Candidatus Parcubacteria bacterium]